MNSNYIGTNFDDFLKEEGIMTDKQIIIDVCPYQGECSVSGCKRNDDGCFVRQLFEERDRAENRIVELNKTIKAKEQECERLKEKLCSFENCTNFEKYGKEIAKLKQTLNEIKQIAIREFETSRYNGSFTWKQILQKISECEVEDE